MATARVTCAARLSSGAFASGSRGGRGGKPRGGGTRDERRGRQKRGDQRQAADRRGASKSFIILPADGAFASTEDGGGGWTLWQESEAGSVLVGTRRARRQTWQIHIVSTAGRDACVVRSSARCESASAGKKTHAAPRRGATAAVLTSPAAAVEAPQPIAARACGCAGGSYAAARAGGCHSAPLFLYGSASEEACLEALRAQCGGLRTLSQRT